MKHFDTSATVAKEMHPMIFTTFTMQPGLKNGRNHYASDDGAEVISSCGTHWNIASAEYL